METQKTGREGNGQEPRPTKTGRKSNGLPEPAQMISTVPPRGCCEPGAREWMDNLLEMKRSGVKLKPYGAITAALQAEGYQVTRVQVGDHLRGLHK